MLNSNFLYQNEAITVVDNVCYRKKTNPFHHDMICHIHLGILKKKNVVIPSMAFLQNMCLSP